MPATERGGWISIEVPAGSWPVDIELPGYGVWPAFIDNVRDVDGTITTLASIRCPKEVGPGRRRAIALLNGRKIGQTIVHVKA